MCRSIASLSLGLLLAMHSVADAAVTASLETDIAPAGGDAGAAYTPTFIAGGPSSIDLLEGMFASEPIGNHTRENSLGLPALTNGSVTTAYGSGNSSSSHAAYATAGDDEMATYSLGDIYNLESIVVYGGWNDGGRDAQGYDIYVSGDGAQNFSLLTSFDNGLGAEQGVVSTPVSHRVEIVEDSLPFLANEVTHVRFDFQGTENGWTGYTEIDIFGSLVYDPGDADLDGDVDIDDFFVISNNFYTSPSSIRTDGDVLADNFIDEKDFRLWKVSASAEVLAQFHALSAPEPTTLTLFGISIGLLAIPRRG